MAHSLRQGTPFGPAQKKQFVHAIIFARVPVASKKQDLQVRMHGAPDFLPMHEAKHAICHALMSGTASVSDAGPPGLC
jgi:hypothetical protein